MLSSFTDSRLQLSFRHILMAFGILSTCLTLWSLNTWSGKLTTYRTNIDGVVSTEPSTHDWLIATISPALAQRRRNMIRTSWQARYNGPPATMRFILANAGEQWMDLLVHEQNTYGDLIMLDHLQESHELGLQTKELDFFVWLVEQGEQWKFVSKIDDDAYLDANAFYDEFLQPQLQKSQSFEPDGLDPVIIGRHLGHGGVWSQDYLTYPGGQFYTMSWPVIDALARQYNTSTTRHPFADVLIGILLDEAKTNFTFIDIPTTEAFELAEGQQDTSQWMHDVLYPAINPHGMKDDNLYLKISSKMSQIELQREEQKTFEKLHESAG